MDATDTRQVCDVDQPLPAEVLRRAAAVLRVLAHADRLRIVELLGEGALSVSELTRRLGLAQNTVSQHLNFMKAHGILASRREGRSVFYEVVHPHAKTVLGCIRRNAAAVAS
jgi:DNA-binding transcriptional ArsR family regulator